MGIRASGITDWWAHGKPDKTQASWDSWQAPHRESLPTAVQACGANSVYEIGCGAGPNLRLLAERFPGIKLGGSDCREQEIVFLNEQLDLSCEVRRAPHAVSSAWEATLACYSLSYLSPPAARRQLRLIQSRFLILIEPWRHDTLMLPTEFDVSPAWHHDWAASTRATGWKLAYKWPIYPIDYLTDLAIYQRL